MSRFLAIFNSVKNRNVGCMNLEGFEDKDQDKQVSDNLDHRGGIWRVG